MKTSRAKLWAGALLLASTLGAFQTASAALRGIQPGFPKTDTLAAGSSAVYTASDGRFVIQAVPFQTDFDDGNGGQNVTPPPSPTQLRIEFLVDKASCDGNYCKVAAGVPGADFVLTGTVTKQGGPTYTGTLLTGEIVEFGYFNFGGTVSDLFDFRFVVTGGALAPLYAGNDLGVSLTVEYCSGCTPFNGSFAVNFNGTPAKPVAGPVPPLAKVGDRVWLDKNRDGIQDCTDTNGNGILGDNGGGILPPDVGTECNPEGKNNVTVKLHKDDGDNVCEPTDPLVGTTTTGNNIFTSNPDNGFYLFAGLQPGQYCVQFVPPPGCAFTTQNAVGSTPGNDSDPSPATGLTAVFSLLAGQTDFAWDAGLVCAPSIQVEKLTNGKDADSRDESATSYPTPPNDPTNPTAAPNSTVNWTYLVTNTGTETLNNVTVTDDAGTPANTADDYCFPQGACAAAISCPQSSLIPGATMTCTASALAQNLSSPTGGLVPVVGKCGGEPNIPLYENYARATGTSQDTNTFVEDEDASHYCNPRRPGILLEKLTNLCDADTRDESGTSLLVPPNVCGTTIPTIGAGQPVTWTYLVTNTGNTTLTNVVVTDDSGTAATGDDLCTANGACASKIISCTWSGAPYALASGETVTCQANGTAANVSTSPIIGTCGGRPSTPLYENKAVVVGSTGTTPGTVTDDDPSHYCNPPPVLARLGDRVWLDQNLNGSQECTDANGNGRIGDPGMPPAGDGCTEPGIPGVPVDLLDCLGNPVLGVPQQLTDAGGFYLFDNLQPGCYRVKFTRPSICQGGFDGWTTPKAGGVGDVLDSDAATVLDLGDTMRSTADRPLVANQTDRNVDAGLYCLSLIQECQVAVDKTCVVPTPPPAPFTTCKGKLKAFTLIWPTNDRNGNPLGPITISGIANDAPGGMVNPGQKVVFADAWGTNDLYLTISGSTTGQSTFHVSCSDADMDGENDDLEQAQLPGKSQDCGKYEGNGKAKTGYVNEWIFDGLVDAENKTVSCTPASTSGLDACEVTLPPPAAYTCAKPLDDLTMYWNGSLQFDTIYVYKTTYSSSNLATSRIGILTDSDGGDFEVGDVVKASGYAAAGATNDVDWVLLNGCNGASNCTSAQVVGVSRFHRSCSDSDMDGVTNTAGFPQDCGKNEGNAKGVTSINGMVPTNDWLFLGMTGANGPVKCASAIPPVAGGAEVIFKYKVSNVATPPLGSPLSNITVVDVPNAPAGVEGSPIASLGVGASQTLEETVLFTGLGTYTNTVTVTGFSQAAVCSAADTVTVKVKEPPLPIGVCSELKPIDGIKLEFDSALTGGKTITSVAWYKTTVSNLSSPNVADLVGSTGALGDGDIFTFSGFAAAGATNDVDFIVTLSDGSKVRSRFHRSCSDADMNDVTDCGKLQGDGKDNASGPNIWYLRDLIGNGKRLGCPTP
jgi:hypothetical protein